MNSKHILKTFSRNNCIKFKSKCFCLLSTRLMSSEPAVQPKEFKREIREKRVEKRKPKIDPFAKNFFYGLVNTDIFPFPEILNKEELYNLDQIIAPVENLIDDIIRDGSHVNRSKILEALRSVDLFGINVPVEYGGLSLNVTETCRFKEVLWKNNHLGWAINSMLGNGVEGILKFGTDGQRKQYLPKILAGDCTPVSCISEHDNVAMTSFNTKAKLNPNKSAWVLNGEKIVYSPIRDTDLLLVLATTSTINQVGDNTELVTAFLVESNATGVEKISIDDNCHKITFTDVIVAPECILGKEDSGVDIASTLMTFSRISSAIACSSIAKDLLSKLSSKIINSSKEANTEGVQGKISEIACSIYAMESMIYLTAGLLDGYEDPDCIVETAMLKVYSTEECLKALLSSIQIFGADNYFSSTDLMTNVENIIKLQLYEEGNDFLNSLIGMLGLQQAGILCANSVKKIRNPFMNPGFIFKRLISHRHHVADKPKLTLQLKEYVHPSLTPIADLLEYGILRLQYISEMLLARNGLDVVSKEMEVKKIAIAATQLYAMFAVISRASRSYCIGLQNAQYEVQLAVCVCKQGIEIVKNIIRDLEGGPYCNNDSFYLKMAEQIYKSSGIFTKHSLAINF